MFFFFLLQLHLQGSFTGIQYTDATVKVLKKDSEQITRQHCLQGECSGLTFQADFKVEETDLKVGETILQSFQH